MSQISKKGGRAVWLALFVCACGKAPPPAEHHLQGQVFGTTWNVKWTGKAGDAVVSELITRRLEAVDASMSTWRADSEVNRLRVTEGGLSVSPLLREVIGESLRIASLSGGAFDPTVEPLVAFWTLHGPRRSTPPDPKALAVARAKVGWRRIVQRGDHVDLKGTALDLSAIAKGYGVDRVADGLLQIGVLDFLVEVGGEVRTHGTNVADRRWTVGVDDPIAAGTPGASIVALIAPGDGALATSGNYRNHYTIGELTVVHTLDPRLGVPVQSDVLSASVVAPSCATADGWATALMVLGTEGLPLIEAESGVEALLILGDGSQRLSSGMELGR